MPIHITKIYRDELIKHIFDELVERNKESEDYPNGYNVDAFYTDIVNINWGKLFVIDDEFVVDFNCAMIEFIISDNHFSIADKVIIASELLYYSENYLSGDEEEVKEEKNEEIKEEVKEEKNEEIKKEVKEEKNEENT